MLLKTTLQHHLSSEILMRLVEQCFMQQEDGTLWGYRALVPGATVIDHAPLPISKEGTLPQERLEAPTKGASEEVIDGVSCKSERFPLDEEKDKSIEDDEDTTERPAINISSPNVPLAPIASVSLNGHNNELATVNVEEEQEVEDFSQLAKIEPVEATVVEEI